jgi:GNAT superfamily N-acetyltransferase
MANIEIRKVKTNKDLARFIDVHYDLYEGNEYDAPNLFLDEMNTLRKDKNAAFEFCDADYFIAYKDGKAVGRIAAIINYKANERWEREDVRFGWIDFIDDMEVSSALFKAVEEWGRERGMKQIVGPLGFTDMDPEGMLTEGFDQLGTMTTPYNYPYYPEHMKKLGGWEKDIDYVECKLPVPDKVPEKYAKISKMIQERYGLRIKKLKNRREVFKGGYGQKVFDLINVCYKDLYGYSELTQKQIDQYVKMYLSFIDYNIVTLIEDSTCDNKLVGIGITIPSLTRALQKCRRGRLFPFGWWHILMALKFHRTKIVDCLLVGVLPEYRKKGANALLFSDLIPRYVKYGWEWGETQVEMETNHAVQSQWSELDVQIHKRRRCYKKKL